VEALRGAATASAICDDYRAAATVDLKFDAATRENGDRIDCPTLVLWDGDGGLERWYGDAGGPLEIWRRWARDVTGQPMPGGHFFPEAYPEQISRLVARFLSV
jgi:haloacetate dehalogenase